MRKYPNIRLGAALLVAIAAAGALALSALAVPPPPSQRPQPFPKAQNDGCQRSPGGLATGNSPAWVYVNKDRRPRLATGTVFDSRIYHDDLQVNHRGYDWNGNVQTDPAYANLIAGDPSKHTGNFAPADEGERVGALHSEWENQALPTFVWPTERDRVKLWGSWIWDCAHWGTSLTDHAAADPGEKTEFHPLRALVVQRRNRFAGSHGAAQTDAFISSEGTRAHASAECALKHHAVNGDSYDSGFKPCMLDLANERQPVNDMNYTFFAPAPPKPSASAQLVYRETTRVPGGPPETIVRKPNGIEVTVQFKGFGGSTALLRYGRTFVVGWKDAQPQGVHVVVKLGTLTVLHSLDPNPGAHNFQNSKPPGEYVMFVEVNGTWLRLNKLLPSLGSASDGQQFKLDKQVGLYLPPSSKLRIYGQGWECDVAAGLFPCPKGRNEVALFNDLIGDRIKLLALGSAAGTHTLRSPSGDWTLTYTVTEP